MLSRLVRLVFLLFLSLFLYMIMLSLSLRLGDSNAVSRIAQLLLSFIFSSFPILRTKMISYIGRRRLTILFLDLAMVSFIPFRLLGFEALSTVLALAFAISLPLLLTHKFSTFNISIFHLYAYRPLLVVLDKELNIKGNFYSFALGFSSETVGRITARKAKSLVRHGKFVLPINKERLKDADSLKDVEFIHALLFAMHKDITFIEPGRSDYEGYVDAIVEREDSTYAISIFGCEPYNMQKDEFILLKNIYKFKPL